MIKKTTTVTFRLGGEEITQDLGGGMPLTKGETVTYRKNDGEAMQLIVADKRIDYHEKGKDQLIDITYTLEKK